MGDLDLAAAVNELAVAPVAKQAMSSAGGAQVAATAAEVEDRRSGLLQAFDVDLADAPAFNALDWPLLAGQLGPFGVNPIVFGGGVPVGGWCQLTLYSNGAYNFSGHFHDSGATSYNMSCVYAVRDGSGTVFTFSHRGEVHGTFDSGSRDDDWNISGVNPAIAAAWLPLAMGWSWTVRSGANLDFGGLLDAAIGAVGTATKIVAIVV